jgi:hypothetical protein
MAEAVYILCALTSTACAVLLFRGYMKGKANLLLWSSLCFTGLALNNILLFVDLVIIPDGADLSVIRSIPAVIGFGLLLYGLISETA